MICPLDSGCVATKPCIGTCDFPAFMVEQTNRRAAQARERLERAQLPTGDETALYRCYDATSALVYVGITKSPNNRFAAHRNADWWRQIARIDLEWFPTRRKALLAEAAAIKTEGPIFNLAGVA